MSLHERELGVLRRPLRLCRLRKSTAMAAIFAACVLARPVWAQQSQPAAAQTQTAPAAREPQPADEEMRAALEAAREAYLAGNCKEAVDGLARAVAALPDDALAHYQLGFCLQRIDQREQALVHKRRARNLFGEQAKSSDRWEPYYYLAALEGLDFSDKSKAKEFAVQGLARIEESEELSGVDCFRASRLAGFAERPQDAARWMERAADRFAAEENPPPAYATEALWGSGEKAFQTADYERARDRLERAAELSETAQNAWYLAGMARLRLGDREGAVKSLRRLTQDPARTEAQYAIRVVLRSDSLTLPEALPDGRTISGMRSEDQTSALRRACAGEFQEESEPLALALLMDFLKRGQTLREMTLMSGCIDLLFR